MVASFYRRLFFPSSCSQRGMSMIELIVVMGIISAALAVALPRFNQAALNLSVAEQTLVANIRLARAQATTRGARFKVTLASNSYSIQRLQDDDDDGVWDPDSAFPAQDVELPDGITLTMDGASELEFTTRGLLADLPDGTPASIVEIAMHDAHKNETREMEIWPSGQIGEV